MPDNGPYANEREAHAAAVAAVPLEEGWSILRQDGCRELLHRALDGAGVETSAFEERTLDWLAGWEDYVCAIIAGWVTRAAQAASEVRECKHCEQEIRRCPDAHRTVPEYPPCKGWTHSGLGDQAAISHCCGGIRTNPVAEPRKD